MNLSSTFIIIIFFHFIQNVEYLVIRTRFYLDTLQKLFNQSIDKIIE